MKIAFAGDRDIAVWILQFILDSGCQPEALLLSEGQGESHAKELESLFKTVSSGPILRGNNFKDANNIEKLKSFDLDFIIGIHFPYIIPTEVLEIPKHGFINLHPAYLPFNKGWHTPSWAILEGTPIGATLHFMSVELDGGDIIHQKEIRVSAADTADSLYAKLKTTEFEVFKEAWPALKNFQYPRSKQVGSGTSHVKKDLFSPEVQEIVLEQTYGAGELLTQLRALTTSELREAAYFIKDNKKYRVQVSITEENI